MLDKRMVSLIFSKKVQKAMDGLYSSKGYDQNDRDNAAFVVISGGPHLLHVLHQTRWIAKLINCIQRN